MRTLWFWEIWFWNSFIIFVYCRRINIVLYEVRMLRICWNGIVISDYLLFCLLEWLTGICSESPSWTYYLMVFCALANWTSIWNTAWEIMSFIGCKRTLSSKHLLWLLLLLWQLLQWCIRLIDILKQHVLFWNISSQQVIFIFQKLIWLVYFVWVSSLQDIFEVILLWLWMLQLRLGLQSHPLLWYVDLVDPILFLRFSFLLCWPCSYWLWLVMWLCSWTSSNSGLS